MQVALNAFRTACQAVNPYLAVQKAIDVQSTNVSIGKSLYNRCQNFKIVLIGFGKAVLPMTAAAEKSLGDLIKAGIVVAPRGSLRSNNFQSNVIYAYEAATNNLPDEDSLIATEKILQYRTYQKFTKAVLGGGSALFSSPRTEISLSQKLETIRSLTSRGATIQQLNIVRQRLSRVKGGKILKRITSGRVFSLIVSDIINDPVELIASGPTIFAGNENITPNDVIQALKAEKDLPREVVSLLQAEETAPIPSCSWNYQIISSNSVALAAVENFFREQQFSPLIVSRSLCGNATDVGKKLADLASVASMESLKFKLSQTFPKLEVKTNSRHVALIFGGETTVLVQGNGKGGRNQEICLSALVECKKMFHGQHFTKFLILSCGTDGQDGPTDAAGAYFASEAVDVDSAETYLKNSDSYSFWERFEDGIYHVKTGPTHTNVMDIQMVLIDFENNLNE
ncbi:unnamed protein product, partial [Mesorhabditis belari]|uniref:Glycerate kinase n=1 Tax=Mesorhabditis belari TaxID=2138241 RepID=A0AAF3J1E8_9BILA